MSKDKPELVSFNPLYGHTRQVSPKCAIMRTLRNDMINGKTAHMQAYFRFLFSENIINCV